MFKTQIKQRNQMDMNKVIIDFNIEMEKNLTDMATNVQFKTIEVLAKIYCFNVMAAVKQIGLEPKKDYITPSKEQTKEWRKEQIWYKNGKKNECEKYQKTKMEEIIGFSIILNTNMRFHKDKNIFQHMTNPNTMEDGFEWTEDMDGECDIYSKKIYFNFKMVCDQGGAQTRTLREVYEFIKAQLNWSLKNSEESIMFINILDGDCSYKYKTQINYQRDKIKRFESIKDKIFIGDLSEFQEFWNKRMNN